MLFNYIFENSKDIMFYSLFVGTSCIITGSFIKSIFFSDSENILLETPTSDIGVDTIKALTSPSLQPTPTLHNLTTENLSALDRIFNRGKDAGTQTESFNVINSSDVGTQTVELGLDKGIQTVSKPILNIDISPVEFSPDVIKKNGSFKFWRRFIHIRSLFTNSWIS